MRETKVKLNAKKLKRRKKRSLHFNLYIQRINRIINSDMEIDLTALRVLNDLLNAFMHNICKEASILRQKNKRKTLHVRDILIAMEIVCGRELFTHGHLEGMKALILLTSCQINS